MSKNEQKNQQKEQKEPFSLRLTFKEKNCFRQKSTVVLLVIY